MAGVPCSISFINLLKKSIPLCSPAITITHPHRYQYHQHSYVHIPTLSFTPGIITKPYPSMPLIRRSLAATGTPPEFPSRQFKEVEPATPQEMPAIPTGPPEIEPGATPDEFIQTPPDEIWPPNPPPDPTPTPPGPGFPHPPIPSPPGPEVIPPPPTEPDMDPPIPPPLPPDVVPPVPPEIFPPPSTPPPDMPPPPGPVII